ncbi:hypothetical protein [Actinomadura sp. 7K534]|uniref:hypothetical protein n=1 Tax=Actinomadura sp. 7K534 TaxID=2530366 RepID=UPI00104FC695|nr:hypothetical protein [Actinomadura sp. 7K534]TDB98424.1 hypothetical protein E1266_03410 [Actinomadura sp. 7K534]
MKIIRSSAGRAVPAAIAAVSTALTLAVAVGPAARAETAWTVRQSPFTLGFSRLLEVSAAGPDSLWIGGYQWHGRQTVWCPETGPCTLRVHQNPTLQRWTGSGWSWDGTPGMPGHGQIKFLDAVSAGDVWAAGSRDKPDGTSEGTPYLAHATAQGWSEVAAPASLRTIEALDAGAQDTWVAGMPVSPDDPSVYRHSAGTWVPHTLGASIQGVRQRTPGDVWAVGRIATAGGQGLAYAARFDGFTWRTVTPPQAAGKKGRLVAVLPLAADDVWVTGYVEENGVRKDSSYHWDGSTWREDVLPPGGRFGGGQHHTFGPDADTGYYAPDGLIEDGAGGLWAVPSANGAYSDPRILHYTNGSWRLEQTLPHVQGAVQGITRVPGTDSVWAVGFRDGGNPLVISAD